MTRNYPTDVSDEEWELLKPELCAAGQQRRRGRVASEASVRACFNAFRYVLKTGLSLAHAAQRIPAAFHRA